MLKKMNYVLFIILLCLLSGCFGPAPEEKIYTILEEAVTLEDSFKEQQQPLLELEKKEADLYNKIMDLGMKEFEQVVSLSKQALTSVEERESKIQMEYDSIMSSKDKFNEINEEIEKIKDETLLQSAQELKSTMEGRYKSYEKLYENYKKSISLDKELYSMLQKEDLEMEQLETQIDKINKSYQSVMEQNNEFNKLTEQYNDLKIKFYEEANLNVEKSE
ncbi:YkyA family protein [Metabacillus endolithicus]|uniref:YkyA family protein n=1 Tax=Metabacillus endolithicus TaxID=1535204 RepID=A0ABW5BTF3_9BACI|nr:YkyA family protein [Metabacillus endolithicus]UPG63119.1 YkyA family protein [Metabacillus endolithicus]